MFEGNRKPDFRTPKPFMKWLKDNWYLEFDLDAAASRFNAKAPRYFTEEDDSLNQDWFGKVWLNPPYGRGIEKWFEKCAEQIQRKEVQSIHVLVPARTDTKWFHELVMPHAYNVYLIKGRLNFEHETSIKGKNAPFPSMLILYRKHSLPDSGITTLEVPPEARGQ